MVIRLILLCTLLGFVSACSSRPSVNEQSSGMKQDPGKKADVWRWDYQGERGPENWAKLNPQYQMCASGTAQSPINLVWHKPEKNKPLQVNYKEVDAKFVNTGYTYRIEVTPQSSISFMGKDYILEKIEFRNPSEHTLSGNKLPLEMQFYHRSSNGLKQAIISMFVMQGKAGRWFDKLWTIANKVQPYQMSENFRFDPSALIPPRKTFYHYEGSLTHPPCLEGVQWIVFNTPLQLNAVQLTAFRAMYSGNARPAQPLGDRKVTNY